MNKDNLKKIFVFSSPERKQLIENALNIESSAENRTISYLIEAHILNGLLPKEYNAAIWMTSLYAGTSCLGDTVESVFQFLAAGINGNAKYSNGKPLVEFAFSQFQNFNKEALNFGEDSYYFHSCLESIIDFLEFQLEHISEDRLNNSRLRNAIHEISRLCARVYPDSNAAPNPIVSIESINYIYMTLLDLWDYFGNWTYTYRLLACIARSQSWTNESFLIMKFKSILAKISAEWLDES